MSAQILFQSGPDIDVGTERPCHSLAVLTAINRLLRSIAESERHACHEDAHGGDSFAGSGAETWTEPDVDQPDEAHVDPVSHFYQTEVSRMPIDGWRIRPELLPSRVVSLPEAFRTDRSVLNDQI